MDATSPIIVKTDTLKAEIFQMATVDTAFRFCYRIIEPVEFNWQVDGKINIAAMLTLAKHDFVGTFLLQKWQEMMKETKKLNEWAQAQKEFGWLDELQHVQYTECTITPTSNTHLMTDLMKRMRDGMTK